MFRQRQANLRNTKFNRTAAGATTRRPFFQEVIITNEQAEKKKPNRVREHILTFRVTPDEREMIERRMAQTGIKNFRAYLLKMAIDGQVVHVELNSVKEMCRLLSNATNNINQIARRANQTDSVYAEDIADIQARYAELWKQAKEIMRRLAAI
jgi:uncharacterized protein (DUF1778 family)